MTTVILQAAAQAQQSMWTSLIFILLLFLIMYIFLIRPQQKQQKRIQQFREKLQEGDEVVTAGGIKGKVVKVKPDYVVLEIADGVKIRVLKSSIYPESELALQR